jgi:hypothetical protein
MKILNDAAASMMQSVLIALLVGCSPVSKGQKLSQLKHDTLPFVPETVTVKIRNYCPAAGRVYKDLFVSNFSAKVVNGVLQLDSDRDGLSDAEEHQLASRFGFSPEGYSSNTEGFSDLLLYLAGIDSSQQGFLRCSNPTDYDGDGIFYNDPRFPVGSPPRFAGLTRCEENQLSKTHPDKFDTDGDGIPDYLEFRCGLNPKNPNDAFIDTSGDGVLNIDKCKRNLPISENSTAPGLINLAYRYKTENFSNSGQNCMNFTISNIPVLNQGADNLIAFYLTEQDSVLSHFLYTASIILPAESVGKTFVLEFGPGSAGRFTAK